MNKTAIKNFAIWARNKLIADITYKAGLLGVNEKEIKNPLPQSTQTVQFFDIGTKEPSSITGHEIEQRKKLVEEIQRKAGQSDYPSAYKNIIEEVAYTWFNRLIAIRFMEVNDYLPTRIRVLSSESNGKAEPDLVTHTMEASLDYSAYEKDRIMQLKHENKLDELFRMLFIKQCNALNANLPELFEKTSNYTELLLNVSFTDKDGVVYHLVNDIPEDDFNVSKEGQVEIIGWLYQYYNTEPKDETFALLKKNVKITKERIPAATQLFTPDWLVRYMVENSLGRLWIEGHPNDELKTNWKYYLDEAEQEEDVQKQLEKIRQEYKTIKPEDIKVIDPAMGSGHILVYAFDVLMQIYESYGYSQRDAAKNILEHNLYGLDIDNRAYQLAYFAVMMKARQYNRRILNGDTTCHVYSIQESNDINRNQLKYFGSGLSDMEKNTALLQIQGLLDTFTDAKEYGSILNVENFNWELLRNFIKIIDTDGQMSLDTIGVEDTRNQVFLLIKIGEVMAHKYGVVITNPPYMGSSGMSRKLSNYVKKNYADSKSDLFAVFIEKCTHMTQINRYQAMITQHAWMFLSSYEKLRQKLLLIDTVSMAHLGARAFDEIGGEVVQTTSFVRRNNHATHYKGIYVRLIEPTNQSRKEKMFLSGINRHVALQNNFTKIPGVPIAYWLSKNVYSSFEKNSSLGEKVSIKSGLQSSDNNRFLRFWHEVSITNIRFRKGLIEPLENSLYKWIPHNKGGAFRKWYGNKNYIVNWKDDGKEIKEYSEYINTIKESTMGVAPNSEYYFHRHISWSLITSGVFSCRYYDDGMIFDISAPSIFIENQDMLIVYLALLNSVVANFYINIINPTINFSSGVMKKLPITDFSSEIKDNLIDLAKTNIDITRKDWDSYETSWDFKRHPLVNSSSIRGAYDNWETGTTERYNQIKSNEEELNRLFIGIYNLQDELVPEVEDKYVTSRRADITQDIRSFISYTVGCMLGRYSLDVEGIAYAGGDWEACKYISYLPDKDNIIPITDEEYFKDDIVGLFITFVKSVYGEDNLEENLVFIANALGNKGNNSRETIRNYFIKDFFNDHCIVYQKRPIYWLFDSGIQNGFKALIYMHRYDENIIGNLRIDYLHKMQRIYENEIARMLDTIENSKDAREVTAATKRKGKLIKQLQETKEYDEKIAHLALARISIDLDDGVKVNYEKVQTDTEGKKLEVLANI